MVKYSTKRYGKALDARIEV